MSQTLPTVLVIDDDESVRKLIAQQLKFSGYPVLTARDGFQALEILEQSKVDVMVVDLVMPGKDGVQTITNVRITHPEIRIIAISGDIDSALYLKAADNLGVDAGLQKPFTHEQLLEALKRVGA